MLKHLGTQTVYFAYPPAILSSGSVVGSKEGKGPLGELFDEVLSDDYYGEVSWEKAERKMLATSIEIALQKANLTPKEVQFLLAGDLLDQTISANFAAQKTGIPFFGLFGACATIIEGLALAAMLIDGGFASRVVVASSSHYGTAERQYRFPTEQGVQRPPSAQWTVTGAAALLVGETGAGPKITHATIGKVVSLGVKDPTDLGTVMAPAAADTMVKHFQETGQNLETYDLVVTGDLGKIGVALARELAKEKGYDLGQKHADCGLLIYAPAQDTHAGGSGCACSAVVLASYFLPALQKGTFHRLLFTGTGALLSPTLTQQGDVIPALGHAVTLTR